MAKKNWGEPAYKGRPHPLKIANRIILVLILLLLIGFIKAGLREGWF
jgi:hypothetical protein